jgi:DNA (cytosine-5)-methyltransferase 1
MGIHYRPTVIDMFSGCGGLSRGFMDAGYEILLGVDNDPIALKTFKENHKNSKVLEADLFEHQTILEMKKIIGNRNVDLIVGGPPCQGFSLTGRRDENDKRNTLFKSMIEAAKVFNPQAFVLENVPGLATLYNGKVKDAIIENFTALGYTVNFKVLFAPDYGVPQIRKRIFFVGIKGDEIFTFPEPTHMPHEYITCGDAISDLPSLEDDIGKEISFYDNEPQTEYQKMMRANTSLLYNHVGTRHTDYVKQVISLVPEGGNYKDLPPGVGESRRFNEAWTRYHSQKPSRTIDTGHRNHFHYKYNRVPTVRENARLQTFTDDFVFYGNKTQQYRQVGNAVPPLLGYHIGKKLKSYIKIRQEV